MGVAASPARTYAPGSRVVIRDEEWIVRSVHQATFGGSAVRVTGISELVRNKAATFLTELDEITELRPEETQLVPDDSPRYRRSRLYLEALLRKTPPTDPSLYVGHRGAINRVDYQLQPAQKALKQPRPRILMADGVGMGKTIEVGILLSELIRRGRADRILVVALKSILAQFQEDLWARFTIPLVRLDSVGIQRLQTKIPSNMNPFYFYSRVIISIDTLKKDAKYRRYLEACSWDVVVVDECQNVAVRTKGSLSQQSQRARLAKTLSRTSDALILTSATPHDGSARSFASLMNLLEPTAVANEDSYTKEEIEHLFIRRFKKDVESQAGAAFKKRIPKPYKVEATEEENNAFENLSKAEFKTIDRKARKSKGVLFRTLLLKGLLSSPIACESTIDNRLKHKDMEDAKDPAVYHDREVLNRVKADLQAITPDKFSKYNKLLELLGESNLAARDNENRVVIFSERIATLKFLQARLAKDLKLKKNQIQVFHGSLDDQSQKRLVKDFGTKSTPVRILLASDAASEGINLHFFCHRLIHFDLPWSLITLNQRNGRIDRYGQQQEPELSYLLSVPADKKLQGDLRVLDRLIEKEDMASKNLGDAAWLMNLHSREKEEEAIAAGIQAGEDPENIIPEKPKNPEKAKGEEEEAIDIMEVLFGDAEEENPPKCDDPLTLYADDLAYARDAFEEVLGNEAEQAEYVDWHDHLDGLTVRASEDLLRRCDQLPVELKEKKWEFNLTTDRERVMKSIEEARDHEDRWPEWQLFWELHPVADWLNDRVLGCFDRHEAPVLRLAKGLALDESVVVFQGVLSNRRSQPVIVEWFGIKFAGETLSEIVGLESLAEQTGLGGAVSNPGRGLVPDNLASLLHPAVQAAAAHMSELRLKRMEALAAPLRSGQKRLSQWKQAKIEFLDEQLGKSESSRARQNIGVERTETEKLFEARKEWIEKGMKTVKEPHLRIAAVLIHQGA